MKEPASFWRPTNLRTINSSKDVSELLKTQTFVDTILYYCLLVISSQLHLRVRRLTYLFGIDLI